MTDHPTHKQRRPQRPYVGDQGTLPQDPLGKASMSLTMIAFALVTGFVIGFAVWALFCSATFLTNALWSGFGTAPAGITWLPLVICPVGGLVIGLFTARFGGQPEELPVVLGTVRTTGGYTLKNPSASAVGFLLPLVFGGSIGPEAGLTGLIAAACTRLGTMLRKAGLRVAGVGASTVSAVISAVFTAPFAGVVAAVEGDGATASDYDFRKGPKIVLYLATALGAGTSVMAFNALFGAQTGMPRFEGITPEAAELLWVIPCLLAGYLGAVLFAFGTQTFKKASHAWGDHPVLKPFVAGIALGIAGTLLPDVLFPGEEQAFELMELWGGMGALTLIATGLVKCLATPLCLEFGWKGGHFFPLIFSGIALGYGLALISGIDPMFCVAITTATLVSCVQRKPLMALGLLVLCFPVSSLLWMAGACVIGSVLPLPGVPAQPMRSERKKRPTPLEEQASN